MVGGGLQAHGHLAVFACKVQVPSTGISKFFMNFLLTVLITTPETYFPAVVVWYPVLISPDRTTAYPGFLQPVFGISCDTRPCQLPLSPLSNHAS